MALVFPSAHIPSCFAKDRCRGHHIDAVDLRQVRTGHAKQLSAQVELWCVPLLPLAPHLPRLFRQVSALAPVLSLLEVALELAIALGHLLLAKLVTLLFL